MAGQHAVFWMPLAPLKPCAGPACTGHSSRRSQDPVRPEHCTACPGSSDAGRSVAGQCPRHAGPSSGRACERLSQSPCELTGTTRPAPTSRGRYGGTKPSRRAWPWIGAPGNAAVRCAARPRPAPGSVSATRSIPSTPQRASGVQMRITHATPASGGRQRHDGRGCSFLANLENLARPAATLPAATRERPRAGRRCRGMQRASRSRRHAGLRRRHQRVDLRCRSNFRQY